MASKPKEVEKKVEELFPELREKHGDKLKVIELPKDEDEKEMLVCAALVPSRKVTSKVMVLIDKDPEKAFETLIKNCLLTSKEEVLADDHLFYSAGATLSELLPIRRGRVKNY